MNILLKNLMLKSLSDDLNEVNDSLTDLGLLTERHTQDRYSEEEYLNLLDNNYELYNYKLSDNEVSYIVHFLFYHILNVQKQKVTVAWCLGKCYGLDIYKGIINLFRVFKEEDETCQQLIFSMTSLFEIDGMYDEIYSILENPIKNGDLPQSAIALSERINIE